MLRVLSVMRQVTLLTCGILLAACASEQPQQYGTYQAPKICPDDRVQYCDDRTGRGCTCIRKSEIRDLMAQF
jgi:hypothetical protein